VASDWTPKFWPRVAFHVFLSHSAEDRLSLINPVDRELRTKQIIPWVDYHKYPAGRNPMEALRTEVLRCRHVVYFITNAVLKQGRGWTATERAFVDQMQSRLHFNGVEFQHVELPLIFTEPNDPSLLRSVWSPLIPKAKFFRLSRRKRESRVAWSVRTIEQFLQEEESWATVVGSRLATDPAARAAFDVETEILQRLRAVDPTQLFT
jgi:TIR domain-containing protein